MGLSIKKGKTLLASGKYAQVWWILDNNNRIGYANTKKAAEARVKREQSKR